MTYCEFTVPELTKKKRSLKPTVRIKGIIYVKKFDHKAPGDVLLWYNKVHELIKLKSCENAQVMFTMNELLLKDQGLRTFLQTKTIGTKKILVRDFQVPMGVTTESYIMAISRFKATAFKKYDIRYQVSYITNVYTCPVVLSSWYVSQG